MMSRRELHDVTSLVSGAAAALIPAAAGGRDADGRMAMDRQQAILRARQYLREALKRLDAHEEGNPS